METIKYHYSVGFSCTFLRCPSEEVKDKVKEVLISADYLIGISYTETLLEVFNPKWLIPDLDKSDYIAWLKKVLSDYKLEEYTE